MANIVSNVDYSHPILPNAGAMSITATPPNTDYPFVKATVSINLRSPRPATGQMWPRGK